MFTKHYDYVILVPDYHYSYFWLSFSIFYDVSRFCCPCNTEFPFEFRALEVALEAICSFLDARTRELETDVYPALDELISKVKIFFT